MNTESAILVAGMAKETIFKLMDFIEEVESEEGITVMEPEELAKLYDRAMEKKEFQEGSSDSEDKSGE